MSLFSRNHLLADSIPDHWPVWILQMCKERNIISSRANGCQWIGMKECFKFHVLFKQDRRRSMQRSSFATRTGSPLHVHHDRVPLACRLWPFWHPFMLPQPHLHSGPPQRIQIFFFLWFLFPVFQYQCYANSRLNCLWFWVETKQEDTFAWRTHLPIQGDFK